MQWALQVFLWIYSGSIHSSVLYKHSQNKEIKFVGTTASWLSANLSCFLTAWASGTYKDEFLVPELMSSCLCILINFSNPFLQGLFFQSEDTLCFFFFLRTIMCLKELYYLYFVFLRTFLGFQFLQKSFSQYCHKFLINPPYNSIGGFYLLCHCHPHYRENERKKISRAQCSLNILSYLSLPGIWELLWCFPQGKSSMKYSVTVPGTEPWFPSTQFMG